MSETPNQCDCGSDAPRVVVVADSPFMRRLIADVLPDAAIVGTAGDGAEAVDVVAAETPDGVTEESATGAVDEVHDLASVADAVVGGVV